jgi:hypothetical protein
MKILLDSGAYSVFKRGITIELADLITFIKDNQHLLHHYISFDVIPGKAGRRFSDPKAAQQTYRNHQIMKEAGLTPWPVVHRQDDLKWLERYLGDGEKCIALAPHPMSERNAVFAWLRACFALLPSSIKVHGLGITTTVMLKHFSFVSVDSASWVNAASNGLIYLPRFRHRRPDYLLAPYNMSVTPRSVLRDGHLNEADPLRREQVEWCLADAGVTLAQVCDDSDSMGKPARIRVCLKYFQGLAKATDTTIYFVTNIDREQREVLTQAQAMTRLLSFAELQHKPVEALADYLRMPS